MQAKLFGDRLQEALARYEAKQLSSGQIIERLVELAKELRDARHRHEALGLSAEEVAFYDALAGGPDDWTADRNSPKSRGHSSGASRKTSQLTGPTTSPPRPRSGSRSSDSFAATS
jgi:hypothetical protein